MLTLIPRAIARIALALTLILAGLMVCIHVPYVTETLSRHTSNAVQFNANPDTIAKASLATRDFALGTIGTEGLKSTLNGLGLPADGLDVSMLNHLQDCTWIFRAFTNLFFALAITSIVFVVLSGIFGGTISVSNMLWQSAGLAILVIIGFAFWIIANFESFFTWMHSLFFQAGTWTFSSDSLLITMFPTGFWQGMGIVWGVTSIVASIIVIIISQCVYGN